MNTLSPMLSLDQVADDLRSALTPATIVRRDEPLARKTTLRVGGKADFYIEPASLDDLAVLLRYAGQHDLPLFLLGRGSNLLIRDGGIRGFVVCLNSSAFTNVKVDGLNLKAGAGVRLKNLANEARNAGITGLEFLEGIPGSVGGALRMNAGAMGSETFRVLDRVQYMDRSGDLHDVPASSLPVQYRSCPSLKTDIAVGATFRGVQGNREEIEARMAESNKKRWTSQPAAPSAGCVFKNNPSIPSGKLIDELGLKGVRLGGAMVSDVHGNFIVNNGNATARDVLDLIDQIKERARSMRGLDLHTEVEIIGED